MHRLALALAITLAACGGDPPRDWGRADTAAMISDTLAGMAPASGDTLAPVDTANGTGALPPGELVMAADSAAGDAIFHRRGQCFTCHGASGAGMARLGPSLRDGVWLHSDGSLAGIRRIVAEGVAQPRESPIAMPGFGRQLAARDLDQVAAYVYSLGHHGSVIHDEPLPDPGLPPDSLPLP